jgi:cytochrome c oxidase cbb3-type subunit 4
MLSGIITAMLLLLFLIGSVWAYSPRRKPEFDAAAKLPLGDDSRPGNIEEETDR